MGLGVLCCVHVGGGRGQLSCDVLLQRSQRYNNYHFLFGLFGLFRVCVLSHFEGHTPDFDWGRIVQLGTKVMSPIGK